MTPEELRHSLFEQRHERPVGAPHTMLCLTCGSLQTFDGETACTEADSYLLPPSLIEELERLSNELETDREDVLRGLLAVALAALERGGTATHTRAVVFLRDLEETEAATSERTGKPGPQGLVERKQTAAEKRT